MIILNPDQQFIVDRAVDWFNNSSEQVFQYDGPPGSGKSVVLNAIVQRLGLDILTEVAPMSFIGAASLVMRMKGLVSAKTAHKWIFDVIKEPLLDDYGNKVLGKNGKVIMTSRFIPKDHLPYGIKLIIIDEAYCMPRKLRPIIEKFGIKILACGDQNQLPPVKDYPAYLVDGKIYHLTQIMRQQGLDDIIFISGRAMMGLPLLNGYYGHSMVIDREDLTDDMLLWADEVICGTNRTRDILNSHIRYLKGYSSSMLPCYGEKVIARNNNWDIEAYDVSGLESNINLVNGLICYINNQPSISEFGSKDRTINVDLIPDLARDCIFRGVKANYDYMISDIDTRNMIKSFRYQTNALIEYAYCITCHLAQGSQFHKVIYIEESMGGNIQSAMNLVGPTRADQQLIYVKNNYKPWINYNDPIQSQTKIKNKIQDKIKKKQEKYNRYNTN